MLVQRLSQRCDVKISDRVCLLEALHAPIEIYKQLYDEPGPYILLDDETSKTSPSMPT